ncbi:MAG TPA: nickel-responsive transcriptional regulator NikR [Caldisericia bacterium]|nr:nickel-responsive transcriptional regulator NikR [Caldisericia bacterium]HQL66232.1 nickel-responsive transcriptional regulator NikR [Caldisericia bacterium]
MKIKRFGVSIEDELLKKFDEIIKEENYPTRSKALNDLIREYIVKKEQLGGGEITGAIFLIYDHHKREIVDKVTDVQHDFHNIIISTLHIHLDIDNCFEIIALRGLSKNINQLNKKLKNIKGIKSNFVSIISKKEEV